MLYEKAFNWHSERIQKNSDEWRCDSRFLNSLAYCARIRGTRRLYNFNCHTVIVSLMEIKPEYWKIRREYWKIKRTYCTRSACFWWKSGAFGKYSHFRVVPMMVYAGSNVIFEVFRWYFRGVKYHRNGRKVPYLRVESDVRTTRKWHIINNENVLLPTKKREQFVKNCSRYDKNLSDAY